MGLMESGLYLTEEWVIHFVNHPPHPLPPMQLHGIKPTPKEKGIFSKMLYKFPTNYSSPYKKKKKNHS
jgi:hypothetical protein